MSANTALIQSMYVAYYSRPADPAGLAYWENAMTQPGATTAALVAAFSQGPEFTAEYAGLNPYGVVAKIYENLFGRDPAGDPGVAYWGDILAAHPELISVMVTEIAKGGNNADGTRNADGVAFDSKVTAATAFTEAVKLDPVALQATGAAATAAFKAFLATVTDDASLATALDTGVTASLATLDGVATNVPGTTFTLTDSIDTVTGTTGNDTILAPRVAGSDTFSSLDNIDGGAGNDTLVIAGTAVDLANAAGVTVKNVETATIAAATTIDGNVSGWTGLTQLNLSAGDWIGNSGPIVAAATTNITVASAVKGVQLGGGKDVSVTTATTDTNDIGVDGAAGHVTVAQKGTGSVHIGTNWTGYGATIAAVQGDVTVSTAQGTIEVAGGTTLDASATGGVSLADQTAHVAAKTAANNAYSAATVGNGGNGTDASGVALTALQAAATGFTNLAAALAPAGTTANYSADQTAVNSIGAATTAAVAAGSITVAQKVTIDAAFIAGLVTSATAARAAALALVTPLQTANTSAVAAAVSADAAQDATLHAASLAADAVVTADTTIANVVKQVTVQDIVNTALTSATVKGNYGASGSQVGSAGGMQNYITDSSTLSNTLTTVTLENTGNSELTGKAIDHVSATGMSGSVTVVNTAAAHTQNFTVSGVTGGTYTDANATTVNVVSAGSATNVLTLVAGAATALNISGAAGLTLSGTTVDAAAVIDASASSGSNSISLALGQKYTGGTGADTVTATTTGTVQAVTVDGGAGTDTLVLGNATNFGTTGAAKYLNFEVIKETGLSVDVSKFTGSTIVAEKIAGATTLSGLTAAQAAAITIYANSTPTIAVTGATTPGQLDVVTTDINDGAAAKATITLTTPSLAGVETWNIIATDHVSIATLAGAAALTNVNVTGAGNVSIATGALALNTNSVIDAHAVTGTVGIDASLSSANGLKIVGSATAANVLKVSTLGTQANIVVGGNGGDTITGGASSVDTITSGNGDNTIDGKGGADVITVGNGNNHINTAGVAYTGNLHVTAGNGYNVIVGGAGNDIITVGTGGNLITGGAGADTITFGAHVAGVTDGIIMAAAGNTFSAGAIVSATTDLTGVDLVTGMQAGDTISIAALSATFTGAAGTTIAAATGTTVSLVHGDYVAATGIWTTAAAGHDTLVVYDNNAVGADALEAIVLVGTVATGNVAAGIITLA